MRASGNSSKDVCALNILRTIRGEVPLARTKGIAREHIDAPASEVNALRADATWALETYEPRLRNEDIDIMAKNMADGDFSLMASIS